MAQIKSRKQADRSVRYTAFIRLRKAGRLIHQENIRKATLREWRRDFAQYLRELGFEANATERAVRGVGRQQRKNGIYRADQRGDSWFLRERAESVLREVRFGQLREESSRARLLKTREDVRAGWLAFAESLSRDDADDLGHQVRQFVGRMSPVQTDREHIAGRSVGRFQAYIPGQVPPLTR